MIRKFVMLAVFAVLAAGMIPAQQAPDSQQPSTSSSSSSQEAPEVDTTRQRKTRPHDYRNWTFNVGGGVNLPNGTTRTFVKGGGGVAAVGAARNFNKYFGLRLDFMWANLPLRNSALQLAQAPGGTDHVYAVTLGDNAVDGSFLAELLLKNGFRLTMLKEEEIDLEDVFMAITKGITN